MAFVRYRPSGGRKDQVLGVSIRMLGLVRIAVLAVPLAPIPHIET
jgi:hypothetical protein